MTSNIVEPAPLPLPPARTERHSYFTEIEAISEMPDVWQKMLVEHKATPDGFCAHRQCGQPGYGTPHVPWPCSSWTTADNARMMHFGFPLRGRAA